MSERTQKLLFETTEQQLWTPGPMTIPWLPQSAHYPSAKEKCALDSYSLADQPARVIPKCLCVSRKVVVECRLRWRRWSTPLRFE